MKNLAVSLSILGVALASGAVGAQDARVRPKASTTAVQTAPNAHVFRDTTTTATPQVYPGLKRPDTITAVSPFPSLNPPRDRITAKNNGRWKLTPPQHIAAVWQPLNEQLEVFAIDPRGTLKDVWKHHNGYWEPSFSLSAPRLAPAGAPLAAVWQPLNEQLEVFTIAPNGALTDTWKAHNGHWFAPIYLSAPNYAPPGAHVAAVFQPLNNQLEVFTIDGTGAVRIKWKAQNGSWQGPGTLTPPGMAPPGAPIAAVWQPLNEQLEVFWIDNTGAMRGVWKQHNGHWAPPFNLTAAGFAGPGAEVAAIWQPLNEQLEVFAADRTGAIKGVWKAHNSSWKPPFTLYGPGSARPGAALTALWDQQNERLHVISVSPKGEVIHAFKTHNGTWGPGACCYIFTMTSAGVAGTLPNGAALAAVAQPPQNNAQLEVFTLDDNDAANVIWTNGLGNQWRVAPITHANLGPIYGAHAADCSRLLKSWSNGNGLISDSSFQACVDFMGITAHCERQNAYVSVGYPPQAESPRFLQCSAKTSNGSDNVIEQAEHIAKGVAEGVADAAIATVVYSPEIIQGYSCLDGVAFACATLAVDLGARAGAVPDEIKGAVNLAQYAADCVDGDIVSCAKLGAAGAKTVGVNIPGEDAGQVALLTQQCANEDYGACLRLGEKAAQAAGVPIDTINQAAKNAQDCYAGDVDACIALGQQAAKAGIPIGGVADGASTIRQCSVGSLADCQQLGQTLASIPR